MSSLRQLPVPKRFLDGSFAPSTTGFARFDRTARREELVRVGNESGVLSDEELEEPSQGRLEKGNGLSGTLRAALICLP